MKVMCFTAADGRQFYNADYCPPLIGETVRRLGHNCQVELLDMTADEYLAIPATNDAAELWKTSAPVWNGLNK